jgi:hypothetical protein
LALEPPIAGFAPWREFILDQVGVLKLTDAGIAG